jgi:competence protein ComEC
VRAGELADAAEQIAGDAFAETLVVDVTAVGVGGEPLARRKRIAAGAMEGELADGRVVSYAFAPDAFEEDCRRAAIIVATRDAPPDCDATVIGRKQWREQGALALYRNRGGRGFAIEPARPLNYDRPWAPRAVHAAANASSQETSGNATAQPPAHSPPPRDATPSSEELQADD